MAFHTALYIRSNACIPSGSVSDPSQYTLCIIRKKKKKKKKTDIHVIEADEVRPITDRLEDPFSNL
jgi:hypothetical protein